MTIRLARFVLPMLLLVPFMLAQAQWKSDPSLNNAICQAGNNQTAPKIISDGSDGAIICWADERVMQNSFDVYAQRIDKDGFVLWTVNGVAVSAASQSQFEPDIATDGAGGAIITWTDTRNGDNDIYAQRISASGSVLWAPNGVPVAVDPALNQANPKLVSDGSGGAIITWNGATGSFPPTSKIYAMRINGSGATVWNSATEVSGKLRFANAPSITEDGSGGAFIAYAYYPRPEYDVYAQRISANGSVQWAANGVGVSTASGSQDSPTIVSDGNGTAFLAYIDWGAGSTPNVYAGILKGDGTMAGFGRVASTTGGQLNPKVAFLGGGTFGAAWEDGRNAGKSKTYVQLYDLTGAKQWTADGLAVSNRTADQLYPYVLADGHGGMIVAWEDKANSLNSHVYAQRMSGTGTALWPVAGVPVCTAANIKQFPRMISDGQSGAIIT